MQVEHYGLRRRRLASGRFERVNEHHSWNANTFFSNNSYFRLQRHADHHMHATKPYYELANVEGSPKLPACYSLMLLLSLFPPAFFAVMNPRVLCYELVSEITHASEREQTEKRDSEVAQA